MEEALAPAQVVKDSITAFATGGQANATQLGASVNRITVCATGGDSVKLPVSQGNVGITVMVINAGAQSLNVFPSTGDQIDGLGANAAKAVAAGKTCDFVYTAGGTGSRASLCLILGSTINPGRLGQRGHNTQAGPSFFAQMKAAPRGVRAARLGVASSPIRPAPATFLAEPKPQTGRLQRDHRRSIRPSDRRRAPIAR